MGVGDNARRGRAVPYVANVWGASTALTSFQYYDLRKFEVPATYGAPEQQSVIRILQPEYGELIACAFFLTLTFATAQANGIKIAVGDFQGGASPTYEPVTSYSSANIDTQWQKINGSTASLAGAGGATVTVDGINLLPLLRKRGDTNFVSDAFVLIVAFDKAPAVTSGWNLARFRVEATAQMGLA